MPGSTVTVPHTLGKQEALQQIEGMLDSAQKQGNSRISDLQESWTSDGGTYSFKIAGMEVKGNIQVSDTDVVIHLDYPLAASPFKGMIESTLRERTQAVLAA